MDMPSFVKREREAIALFLILTTTPCLARLGETVPESTSRYGAPISTITKTEDCQEITYAKNGMVLIEKFFKGVCVGLLIEKKMEITSLGELPSFSDTKQLEDAEVKELLAQNSQGHQWDGGPTLSADRKSSYYYRDDGATAVWKFEEGLTLSSSDPTPYDAEIGKAADDTLAKSAAKEVQGL